MIFIPRRSRRPGFVSVIPVLAWILSFTGTASAQSHLAVLHAFASQGAINPRAPLILATDGNFYGTTSGGPGSIFQMTPTGTVTVLHTFTGGTDGANPYAALIQATDGNFYGTTYSGGTSGLGTICR
jgi:uncharacterized repeat protein (TIGR03803 family)